MLRAFMCSFQFAWIWRAREFRCPCQAVHT